ncbi:MAG: HIT domain-containing protein [bacterium]|nr:HIT domain-containing protein [bacterium]
MDCIFCSIAQHKTDADIVFENDQVFVIKDINPKAKVHLLAIPKEHIVTFNDLTMDNFGVMSVLALAIKNVTEDFQIADSGYKVIANNGSNGGQAVPHLHLHILGGEPIRGVT